MSKPRLLIEEWLPAQALGIESMREQNNPIAKPPHSYLHVWWARRPLTVSRAAVLASLLPADFDRDRFERLLGFGLPSAELIRLQSIMESGVRLGGFGCARAFSSALLEPDLAFMHETMLELWASEPCVLDPMAGGGSIPFESLRLSVDTRVNEYNPVACSILEITLDYAFRFGGKLGDKARRWGRVWRTRCVERLDRFFPTEPFSMVDGYIFARTIPCPDTKFPTPLVPNWFLIRQRNKVQVVAEPVVTDKENGAWTVRIRELGKSAGQIEHPPAPTYIRGKGISLFTQKVIPAEYIKAMAQQGKMGCVLYAVATKANRELKFRPPEPRDLQALAAAERELERLRPQWEKSGMIPTEMVPLGDKTKEPLATGHTTWASMFAPRQLLTLGVLVEELRLLRSDIVREEGEDQGSAIEHLLAFALNKCANYNSVMSVWHSYRSVVANTFSKHDFSFKATFAEMAVCVPGSGLDWAVRNVTKAYKGLARLAHTSSQDRMKICQGSAANLVELDDRSITAVIVDPPYADNVQYSELANFFYVWLKCTQGHRRPDWFSTYLCEYDEEAVVNLSRHRNDVKKTATKAREEANAFYQQLMTDVFRESYRVLRDEGVLTVMFTHKEQSAWAALFESLIAAGFTTTATWPVQTESQHSLHQAKKNAAQSTVILAARKREPDAGRAYFDQAMQAEIRETAQSAAARLQGEGLNAVDLLVGAFGPAMEVFSRYDEVRTDTGERVGVEKAIQIAAGAVADWRVAQLAERGLNGVDNESRFVLLCWDVLGAAQVRFNEAMLLGRSVGMDVNRLIDAGLVEKSGSFVQLLPAKERRREQAVKNQMEQMALLEAPQGRRRRGRRTVHPNDEYFDSAIDMCHALALRHAEAGGDQAGLGAARGMALQQGWTQDSVCARLMAALVKAAPQAVRFAGQDKKTAADEFPEFRAWHAMLKPLFGIEPPVWQQNVEAQPTLPGIE